MKEIALIICFLVCAGAGILRCVSVLYDSGFLSIINSFKTKPKQGLFFEELHRRFQSHNLAQECEMFLLVNNAHITTDQLKTAIEECGISWKETAWIKDGSMAILSEGRLLVWSGFEFANELKILRLPKPNNPHVAFKMNYKTGYNGDDFLHNRKSAILEFVINN